MAKYDPRSYKYLVTETATGKKHKSATLAKAEKVSSLDKFDITSGVEDHGGVDSDTHNVRVQSYGKAKDFAFRRRTGP